MLAAPNKNMIPDIFEPLGYTVAVETYLNDDEFLEWGESKYATITLSATIQLKDLLNHLYVLIPVFDTQKHYYISNEEIEKLLTHGEGWLNEHPQMKYITKRYFGRRRGLVSKALEKLIECELEPEAAQALLEEPEESAETKLSLNQARLQSVLDEVIASGARTVIDMGCGEGNLTRMLIREKQLQKVAATDVSSTVLEWAKEKLKVDRMHETLQEKLTLFQSSLTYRDKRFEGFDCACVVEVIEHMDPPRMDAFARVLFGYSKPKTVVLTTPNIEYNVNYEFIKGSSLRHGDHRFEWNREQFATWAQSVCEKYNYRATIKEIGELDGENGAPTQMGVFMICE